MPEDSPIVGVEVRDPTAIRSPTLREPIALLLASEADGEAAIAAESAFETVVPETDFSRSVLLHAVTWGRNECDTSTRAGSNSSSGASTSPSVDGQTRPSGSDWAVDGVSTLSKTVRVTVADEPPDAGLITFVGQAAELEAVDVETWDPCAYEPEWC